MRTLRLAFFFPLLLTVLLVGVVGPVRAENYALLIGVDKYDSSDITPLRGAVNDALALKEALISVGLCKASNITTLTTGSAKPDRDNILEAAENLVRSVQKGDTVFVFYSGHGCQDGSKTYLLSCNVKTASLPLVKKTAVDVDDFEDALRRLPEARVIIAYDMCRVEIGKDGATTATDVMQSRGMDFSRVNTTTAPSSKPSSANVGPMLVRWWSCSPGERSYETQKAIGETIKWRGYFSSAIERGLRGGAAAGGAAVTLAGLERFVRSTVTDEVKRTETRDQRPRLLLDVGGLDDIHGFVLGRGVGNGGVVAELDPKVVADAGAKVNLRAGLKVTTNVAGATITVGGKTITSGVYLVSLLDEETTKVQVLVKADGYEPEAKDVILERGLVKDVAFTLEKSSDASPEPATVVPPPDFHPTGARELATLKGHNRIVKSASFSPDGKRIVTGDSNKTAIVWDALSGQPLLTLKGHRHEWYGDNVYSASFSADGKRIVTASDDKTAIVWGASSGQPLLTLKGHRKSVKSASFSADSKRIVTASNDKTAIVWDASSGEALVTLKGHRYDVATASFSADGKRIVTASSDETAKVWLLE